MNNHILGALAESRTSTLSSIDPCPFCDGPRRVLRRHGRGAPVTTCPTCRIVWIAGAYAGQRLVHFVPDSSVAGTAGPGR